MLSLSRERMLKAKYTHKKRILWLQLITRGSRTHLHACYYILIVSLILACTKEKRNNVFHEGHVVQRRSCKVLPADTCLPDIHHCSRGSS